MKLKVEVILSLVLPKMVPKLLHKFHFVLVALYKGHLIRMCLTEKEYQRKNLI